MLSLAYSTCWFLFVAFWHVFGPWDTFKKLLGCGVLHFGRIWAHMEPWRAHSYIFQWFYDLLYVLGHGMLVKIILDAARLILAEHGLVWSHGEPIHAYMNGFVVYPKRHI